MPGCDCDPNENHGLACPIIREFKLTPEQRMDEYRKELAKRHAELVGHASVDVPWKLQQLVVPFDVIQAVREPEQRLALEWAKKFLIADRKAVTMLVLAGPRGIGKSVGAGWVLADAVKRYDWNSQAGGGRQWPPFVWAKAADIAGVTEFGRVDPDWLEGLRRCRLLVVDDLGHETTQAGSTALRDVLIDRYEHHKASVLTANLAPQDFKARYGDSWFSRMASSACLPDLSQEKSMRKRPT